MNLIIKIFATGFGLGYLPKMPGTFGSALGIGLVIVLQPLTAVKYLIVVVTISLLAVWISQQAEKLFQQHDAQQIVIDEVAGQLVTFLFVPMSWLTVLAGFMLFRFFDIVKIPPIKQSQRLPGGWGVVVDDVIAGVFANVVVQVALRIL